MEYEGAFKNGTLEGEGVLTQHGATLRGRFEAGALVRGSILLKDGRRFEMDTSKGLIVEVLPDGTKKRIDRLPPGAGI